MRSLPFALALLAALAVPAAAQERERIREERAAAEARFAEAERECQKRFIVTTCTDAAQGQRRETLSRLRKQELDLATAERKQRAAARTEILRAKAADATAAASAAAPTPQAATRRASTPGREVGAEAAPRSPRPAAPAPSPEELAANKAKYEQRERDAQAHRDEVARRNQERASKKKPAAPLPVPPSGSAP